MKRGRTPLFYSVREGHCRATELLTYGERNQINLDLGDEEGSTPLVQAAAKGYVDVADLLVINGADIELVDSDNRPALWWAETYGHTTVVAILRPGVRK